MVTPLTDTLLDFIQHCVPTYEAAQVLLFFFANRDRAFRPEEIADGMQPVIIPTQIAKETSTLLVAKRLVSEKDGAFRYGAPLELEPAIRDLARAYNEQPVTLIRVITTGLRAQGSGPRNADIRVRPSEA